jgi:hypothetical protein
MVLIHPSGKERKELTKTKPEVLMHGLQFSSLPGGPVVMTQAVKFTFRQRHSLEILEGMNDSPPN